MAPTGPILRVGFPGLLGGKVSRWLVHQGRQVSLNQPIAECDCDTNGGFPETVVVLSPGDGTLIKHVITQSNTVPKRPVLQNDEDDDEDEDDATVVVDDSQVIGLIESCSHPQVFGSLCGICGRKVLGMTSSSASGNGGSSASDGTAPLRNHRPLNISGGQKLHVNQEEAESHNERTIRRLFKRRALSLVLDLDHTLLHTTNDARAPAFAENLNATDIKTIRVEDAQSKPRTASIKGTAGSTALAQSASLSKSASVVASQLELYVRLRPGLTQWLEEMHGMFEMYIYTAGTRAYAEAIADVIDPHKKYFSARILSRTDVPELGHSLKSIERFFPIDSSMVVVIDDREDVWKGCRNLVTIEPYHFWRNMADVNNASGEVIGGSRDKEKEKEDEDVDIATEKGSSPKQAPPPDVMDRGLRRVRDLLSFIHRKFDFGPKGAATNTSGSAITAQLAGKGSDVKILMDQLRARIFGGKNLRFMIDPNCMHPEKLNKLSLLICELGGEVCASLDESPTHLLAKDPRSSVSVEARDRQIWVVHTDWFKACRAHWIHEDERRFSLFAVGGSSPVPAHGSSSTGSRSPSSLSKEAPKLSKPMKSIGGTTSAGTHRPRTPPGSPKDQRKQPQQQQQNNAKKRSMEEISKTSSKTSSSGNKNDKYYGVRVGAQVGVFRTWAETHPLVNGFKGSKYKSFSTLAQAEAFVRGDDTGGSGVTTHDEEDDDDDDDDDLSVDEYGYPITRKKRSRKDEEFLENGAENGGKFEEVNEEVDSDDAGDDLLASMLEDTGDDVEAVDPVGLE